MPVMVPPASKRILLVDPEREGRGRVHAMLRKAGYEVSGCATTREALGVLAERQHDGLIVSLAAEATDSRSIAELHRQASGIPILVLAVPGNAREAVRGLRDGAADYLLSPPNPLELETRLERMLERHELDSRIAFFQEQLSKKDGAKQLEARSPAMREVLERVQRVAPMRSTVLITGESGVGKELVARLIHFNSPRRRQPFIALNCAAIPTDLIESELFGHEKGAFTGAHVRTRGKFEIAHRGTMFLDEIGDMRRATQAKLLRVLEQREFMRVGGDQSLQTDVRLIAATNADLDEMVLRNAFRQDLYYRLKVVTIHVPPLRDRVADLPALVEMFLDELSRANAVPRKQLSPEALEALRSHHWPGNVRELKNLVESLLVATPGDTIAVEHLPSSIRRTRGGTRRSGLVPGTTIQEMERELIRVTLEHTGGNRTHSAAMLGIGVRTLQRKIRSYGLEIASTRRGPRRRGSAASGSS